MQCGEDLWSILTTTWSYFGGRKCGFDDCTCLFSSTSKQSRWALCIFNLQLHRIRCNRALWCLRRLRPIIYFNFSTFMHRRLTCTMDAGSSVKESSSNDMCLFDYNLQDNQKKCMENAKRGKKYLVTRAQRLFTFEELLLPEGAAFAEKNKQCVPFLVTHHNRKFAYAQTSRFMHAYEDKKSRTEDVKKIKSSCKEYLGPWQTIKQLRKPMYKVNKIMTEKRQK